MERFEMYKYYIKQPEHILKDQANILTPILYSDEPYHCHEININRKSLFLVRSPLKMQRSSRNGSGVK